MSRLREQLKRVGLIAMAAYGLAGDGYVQPVSANGPPDAGRGLHGPVVGVGEGEDANTEEVIPEAIAPVVIDGVETYGQDSPLDQAETNSFVTQLNTEYANGARPKANNRFYTTGLGMMPEYTAIPGQTGYTSIQKFMQLHNDKEDELVRNADPAFGGVTLRRLIHIQNEVELPGSWHLGYLNGGAKDSNGWTGWKWFIRPYNPTESAYWVAPFDWGKFHEDFHYFLHLPDYYSMDTDFTISAAVTNIPQEHDRLMTYSWYRLQQMMPTVFTPEKLQQIKDRSQRGKIDVETAPPAILDGLPTEWKRYYAGDRNDGLQNGLMYNVGHTLGNDATWQLLRRVKQGWTHVLERSIPEASWSFPYELSPNNILVLGPQYDGATIQIYRTAGTPMAKTLDQQIFSGIIQNGEINIGDPFATVPKTPQGLVPSQNALLFIRVGNEWRWMPIIDLLIAAGTDAVKPHDLRLHMNLANANVHPRDFYWPITVQTGPILKTYLPVIYRN